MIIGATQDHPGSGAIKRDPDIWKAAQSLEASFISEMLKSAGLGKPRESIGGGAGEDQFSSFLTQEYAQEAVNAGGFGLAESIYQSMIRRSDDNEST